MNPVTIEKFNIRIYGLLNYKEELLVVKEKIKGEWIVKFPGGGLEFGEGIKDCLVREFKEELNVEVAVKELLFVNDFFQQSYFFPTHQLICMYFRVELIDESSELKVLEEEDYQIKWIKNKNLKEVEMSFKADQLALTTFIQQTNG